MCYQHPLLLLLLLRMLLLPALPLPLFPPAGPSLPPSLSAAGGHSALRRAPCVVRGGAGHPPITTQGARRRFSGTRRTAASVDGGGGGGMREGMRGIIGVAYTALKRRPHRVSCRELGGRRLTHIFFFYKVQFHIFFVFSKVSALVHLICKSHHVDSFENLYRLNLEPPRCGQTPPPPPHPLLVVTARCARPRGGEGLCGEEMCKRAELGDEWVAEGCERCEAVERVVL